MRGFECYYLVWDFNLIWRDIVLSSLSWIVSIVNILGTALNITNSPMSFFIWTICNAFWVYYDSIMMLHSRILIDIINLIMSFYGFIVWSKCTKKHKKINSEEAKQNSGY